MKSDFCENCRSSVRFHQLKEYKDTESLIDQSIVHWTIQVLGCASCGQMLFRVKSKYVYPVTSIEVDQVNFPERITDYPIKGDAPIYHVYPEMPSFLDTIYKKAIKLYNKGLYSECAINIRRIIEGICYDKDVKYGYNPNQKTKKKTRSYSLPARINGLKQKGIISTQEENALISLKFLGDESLHDFPDPEPAKTELNLAFNTLVNVLNDVYKLNTQSTHQDLLRKGRKSKN